MFIVTGKHLFWKLAGTLLKQKCSWHSQAVLSNVYLLNDKCWLPSLFLSVCREQIWTVSPNLFGLISSGGTTECCWPRSSPEFPAQMPIHGGDVENKGGAMGWAGAAQCQVCLQRQMLSSGDQTRREFTREGYFQSLEYLRDIYFTSQILETYAN